MGDRTTTCSNGAHVDRGGTRCRGERRRLRDAAGPPRVGRGGGADDAEAADEVPVAIDSAESAVIAEQLRTTRVERRW